jgi:hypothetical protein
MDDSLNRLGILRNNSGLQIVPLKRPRPRRTDGGSLTAEVITTAQDSLHFREVNLSGAIGKMRAISRRDQDHQDKPA